MEGETREEDGGNRSLEAAKLRDSIILNRPNKPRPEPAEGWGGGKLKAILPNPPKGSGTGINHYASASQAEGREIKTRISNKLFGMEWEP